jgi:hypothetical protein
MPKCIAARVSLLKRPDSIQVCGVFALVCASRPDLVCLSNPVVMHKPSHVDRLDAPCIGVGWVDEHVAFFIHDRRRHHQQGSACGAQPL